MAESKHHLLVQSKLGMYIMATLGTWKNWPLNTAGFSISVKVGGKTSKVGGEGTTRGEGTILGWECMGACPTWKILKIWYRL